MQEPSRKKEYNDGNSSSLPSLIVTSSATTTITTTTTALLPSSYLEIPDLIGPIDSIDISTLERGKIFSYWLSILVDSMDQPICIPLLIATGVRDGPILGITSCLHGNEVSGIPLIFRLYRDLDLSQMIGTLVSIPIVNTPGYMSGERTFEGADLNKLFPGKKNGTSPSQFVYYLFQKIIKQFHYLIDLHTASHGYLNSLFVRADMNNPVTARLAYLQNPQILIHQPNSDGSLRAVAASNRIHSITVEIGSPKIHQKRFIKNALLGVTQIMSFLKMIPYDEETNLAEITLCSKCTWIHSDVGGILMVLVDVGAWIKKDETFAITKDIFGNLIRVYRAPFTAIVISKCIQPVCQSGDRIILLGATHEAGFVTVGRKKLKDSGE